MFFVTLLPYGRLEKGELVYSLDAKRLRLKAQI
jgi:hypothetical protein